MKDFCTRFLKQVLLLKYLVLKIAEMSCKLLTYRWDQRTDLMCDVTKTLAPFVLSKLWILVADWSMHWSHDTFLIKLRLYEKEESPRFLYLIQIFGLTVSGSKASGWNNRILPVWRFPITTLLYLWAWSTLFAGEIGYHCLFQRIDVQHIE